MKIVSFHSCLAVVCAFCGLLGSEMLAGPTLELTPLEFDFGRQTENRKEYPFEFVLKNKGDAPLLIQDLKAGCGCTKVELAEKEIAPGAEAKLTGVLDTKHFEGPTKKTVFLSTNEGKNYRLGLSIVLPYSQKGLRFSPRNMKTFNARLFGKDKLRAIVNLENCNAEGEVKVLEAVWPEGWTCETKLPLVVKAESRGHFIVTRTVVDGNQYPEAEFVLKTDCPLAGEMRAKLKFYEPPKAAAAAK